MSNETGSKRPTELSKAPSEYRVRQLEPGAASRQRPVSMGPWSPPRSPPTVMLQSPASPPKPFFASASPPKSYSLVPSRGTDKSPFPSPSLRPQSHAQTFEISKSSPKPSNESPKKTSLAGARRPPPVNRAAKPATPTLGSFNLDPRNNESKEKISPFSTPPSSDDSPEREAGKARVGTGESVRADMRSAGSPFSPPRAHQDIEPKLQRTAILSRQDGGSSSTNQKGLSKSLPDFTDHPNQRPILPTRRAVDMSPARSHEEPERSRVENQTERKVTTPRPPPRPSDTSKSGRMVPEFLPPPKRNVSTSTNSALLPQAQQDHSKKVPTSVHSTNDFSGRTSTVPAQLPRQNEHREIEPDVTENPIQSTSYPDASQTNRRPPKSRSSVHQVLTQYDTRVFDLCGRHICTVGYLFRAWDIMNARMIMDLSFDERETKTTALVFKPASNAEDEGLRVWLGNNQGDIQEIDLVTQSVLQTRANAHSRREIIKMYRYQNTIWSLDDEGKLNVWPPSDQGVPSLRASPMTFRVTRGHTFSIAVKNHLWLASGRDIRVYNPMGQEDSFFVTMQALTQAGASEVTAGALISNQLDRVYFGHADGKVTVYSTANFTCLGVFSMSAYKINCLVGAGFYLWAGFNTGTIFVYDTRPQPWKVKKDWQAHQSPVASMVLDASSIWKSGHLQVASIGLDNAIRLWDGMLESDWLGTLCFSHTGYFEV